MARDGIAFLCSPDHTKLCFALFQVQFVGEPGVDAGGLEREWFLLVCRALFDPSTGLFTPQPSNGAFAVNPSSGVANEMHLEYFRFTGRVREISSAWFVPC